MSIETLALLSQQSLGYQPYSCTPTSTHATIFGVHSQSYELNHNMSFDIHGLHPRGFTNRSYDIDNFDLDQSQKEVTMNLKKILTENFHLFIAKNVCIIYHDDVHIFLIFLNISFLKKYFNGIFILLEIFFSKNYFCLKVQEIQ